MPTQLELDWSVRGNQLRTLARCVLPSVTHGSRQTSGASLKAVLRGIDDCVGSGVEYDISISRLCVQSGRSHGTVSAAVAALNSLCLIDVAHNFDIVDGRALQQVSTYRIFWSNVADFIPAAPTEQQTKRPPQSIRIHRKIGSPQTEATHLSLRLPPPQSEATPTSVCDDPHLSLRLPPPQSEVVTAPSRSSTVNSPPSSAQHATASGRRGRLWKWLDSEKLKHAVNRGDSDLIKRAALEAIEAGSLEADSMARQAFAATCRDVLTGTSPVGLLSHRLNAGEINQEGVTESSWTWAGRLLGGSPRQTTVITGIGQAGGCWRCIAYKIHSPTGCEVCRAAAGQLQEVAR